MTAGKLQKKSSLSLLQAPFTLDIRERGKSPIRSQRSRTPTRSQSRERVGKVTKKSSVISRKKNKEHATHNTNTQKMSDKSFTGNIQLSPFAINTDVILRKKKNNDNEKNTEKRKSILEVSKEDLCHVSLLNGAVLKNDYELLRKLIVTDERDVNEVSYEGTTALHVASAAGYLDCVILLLECGADVDRKDYYKRTPLEYAVLYGNFDCAHELIGFGANTNTIKDGISL